MRWSSLMAWMSVVRCNVFYGNDASPLPLTTKPPSALWLHLSAEKWLLTAPLRGEKIFSFPSTPLAPTQKLYIRSSAGLIYCRLPPAPGCIRFELVALMGTGVIWIDLDATPLHGERNIAGGLYRESKAVAWNRACCLLVITAAPIAKAAISHPSEVYLICLMKKLSGCALDSHWYHRSVVCDIQYLHADLLKGTFSQRSPVSI